MRLYTVSKDLHTSLINTGLNISLFNVSCAQSSIDQEAYASSQDTNLRQQTNLLMDNGKIGDKICIHGKILEIAGDKFYSPKMKTMCRKFILANMVSYKGRKLIAPATGIACRKSDNTWFVEDFGVVVKA